MHNRTQRIVAAALAAIFLLTPLSACARKKAPAATVHKVVYAVRAEMVRVPAPDEPAPEIQARHEEIPSFVEKHGDPPTGMRAMTMPFAVDPRVSLEGFEAGTKVLLTFEVDYSVETGLITGYRVIQLEKLAPETELVFE